MKTRLFRIFSASFAVLTGLALAPMQAQAPDTLRLADLRIRIERAPLDRLDRGVSLRRDQRAAAAHGVADESVLGSVELAL